MKTKHTQGPWKVGRALINNIKNNRGIYSCDKDGEFLVAEVQGNNPDSECGANARLIAAAPDLLEALKWALENLGDDLAPDFQTAKKHCEMIVKKAEGESGQN